MLLLLAVFAFFCPYSLGDMHERTSAELEGANYSYIGSAYEILEEQGVVITMASPPWFGGHIGHGKGTFVKCLGDKCLLMSTEQGFIGHEGSSKDLEMINRANNVSLVVRYERVNYERKWRIGFPIARYMGLLDYWSPSFGINQTKETWRDYYDKGLFVN